MQAFHTTIKAICPKTGELKTFDGPVVYDESFDAAQQQCEENGFGYCVVDGKILDSKQVGGALAIYQYGSSAT